MYPGGADMLCPTAVGRFGPTRDIGSSDGSMTPPLCPYFAVTIKLPL